MILTSSPVDEIKERLDITEVLSEYVKLKPAGANRFKVLCPFHNEKTPSLMVSKDKQVWHCFGCGKGGDMFTFVQEIEGVEFAEALRILAKKAKVELRATDPKLQSAKTRLLEILKLTAAFYRKILTEAKGGEVARQYLQQRAVNEDTAEDFQLGYSPTTWDGLLIFLKKRGFSDQDIFDAGLTVKRDRGIGFYDRFRGRLMFPIRDVSGVVVGFAGRILEEAEGDAGAGAKYINSPETIVYSKGRILYGLDLAKQAIKQADVAVLVEGYMDCIASHQAGVKNVVATSGTALTEEQVRLLRRFTNTVALAFDTDLAGGEAARRGIDKAIAADMRVTVIPLAGAKDPDELIRQDPARWRNAIAGAERIVDYSFRRALDGVDVHDVDVKKRVAKQLLPIVAQLPDPVERSHYLQLLGRQLDVDEAALRDTLKLLSTKESKGEQPEEEAADQTLGSRSRKLLVAERMLGYIMFSHQQLLEGVIDSLNPDVLEDTELRALYKQAVLYYTEGNTFDIEEFRKHVARELPLLTNRMARIALLAEEELTEVGEDEARQELEEGVKLLRRERIMNELRRIEKELRQIEASTSGEGADDLLRRMNELTEELRGIEG